MKRRVHIVAWMLILVFALSACGQNSVMNKATLPKPNQTETAESTTSVKTENEETAAANQTASTEAAAANQTESAEESASNQTEGTTNSSDSSGISATSETFTEGGMNRFVNSLSASFGSLASDGISLFYVVNDGKVIEANHLDTADNSPDRGVIYQTADDHRISSLYVKDGWIYWVISSFSTAKCDLLKARTDGSGMTVIAEDFTTLISMEHFYGDWLFFIYSDWKNPDDGDQLVKVSLNDGSKQVLDQSSIINHLYYISDNMIFYKKRINDDMKNHKLTIHGGEPELIDLDGDAKIKGVYQGFIYYTAAEVLYRLPVAGGNPVVVMTSADSIPFINIANGNIYFFFASSNIYELPLDSVNADRFSTPYINMKSDLWQQERVWLFGNRIFLQKDIITSGSYDYVDVTDYPLSN